jgi:sodium-coupled monocarboxylate transporter 8/12
MKLLVFLIGSICLGLVLIVERLGGIFNIGIAFSGITSGAILGLFGMGMLSRQFNSKVYFLELLKWVLS